MTISKFEITCGPAGFNPQDTILISFLQDVDHLGTSLGLVSLDWTPQLDGSIVYKFSDNAGRNWKQVITQNASSWVDPLVTFNVSTPWKLSETLAQQPVRQSLVFLNQTTPGFKLSVVFS